MRRKRKVSSYANTFKRSYRPSWKGKHLANLPLSCRQYTAPVPVREGAARLMVCPTSARTKKGQARDPLAFLSCKANPPPQSCLLPYELMTHIDTLSAADGEGASTDLLQQQAAGSGCLDAARQAAAIVANSLNLPPKLHARTVEAAVAEATAHAVDEAEGALGRSANIGGKRSVSYKLRKRGTKFGINRSKPLLLLIMVVLALQTHSTCFYVNRSLNR